MLSNCLFSFYRCLGATWEPHQVWKLGVDAILFSFFQHEVMVCKPQVISGILCHHINCTCVSHCFSFLIKCVFIGVRFCIERLTNPTSSWRLCLLLMCCHRVVAVIMKMSWHGPQSIFSGHLLDKSVHVGMTSARLWQMLHRVESWHMRSNISSWTICFHSEMLFD